MQFANALYPLINESQPLKEALEEYAITFDKLWRQMMANKLGLTTLNQSDDDNFLEALFDLLEERETDMTLFFRSIAEFEPEALPISYEEVEKLISPSFYQLSPAGEDYKNTVETWFQSYAARLNTDPLSPTARQTRMNASNPLYVLRNYLAQLCIDKAEEGDYSLISEQLDVLRKPYENQSGKEAFAQKRPEWARNRAGCSMLSCSS